VNSAATTRRLTHRERIEFIGDSVASRLARG
jgi:hypothetical protein